MAGTGIVDAPPTVSAVSNDDGQHGILRILTPQQVEELKKPEIKNDEPESAPMTELASHCLREWDRAKTAKLDIERVMIQCLRQREGEYTPEEMLDIKNTGQADIYARVTAIKCTHAEAWLNEILNQAGDKPWGIEPTPIPDLPPDLVSNVKRQSIKDLFRYLAESGAVLNQDELRQAVMLHANFLRHKVLQLLEKEAQDRADNMERLIADQFSEVKMHRILKDFIQDVVTFPAGIIRGPVVRRIPQLTWKIIGRSSEPVVEYVAKATYDRISPFDCFPTPECVTGQEGSLVLRHRITPDSLETLSDLPWVNTSAIREIQANFTTGSLTKEFTQIDNERAILEGKRSAMAINQGTIDMLEVMTKVRGSALRGHGIADNVQDHVYYETTVWMIQKRVIGAQINWHPLGTRPVSKASFEEIPGSFWGHGVPQKLKDVQAMANAAARSIVNNMGMASGPMCTINDINRLAIPDQAKKLHPWKIFLFTNENGSTSSPMDFFMPESAVQELMLVYDRAIKDADEVSGIPAYSYGNDRAAGAGRTFGGLQMLMNAAARGIRLVTFNIDGAVEDIVERQYIHNMLFHAADDIKGDARVVARGAVALLVKEQLAARRNEFLVATNNPTDMQIIGPLGRARVLRQVAATLDMDVDDIVPSDEEIESRLRAEAAMLQQQQQQQPGDGAKPAPKPAATPAARSPAGVKRQIQQGRAP